MPQKVRKNALLTKPIKVLRDTFVRQGDLGFTDLGKLERWLVGQRAAVDADCTRWTELYRDRHYLLNGTVHNAIETIGLGVMLEQLARPVTLDDPWFMGFAAMLTDPLRFLIKTLDWNRVKVCAVHHDRVALVLTGSLLPDTKVLRHDPDEDICGELCDPEEADVFDAALHSWDWWRSANEWHEHPLCVWMSDALSALRIQAGVMFDAAVAVSQDGRRVQVADLVVAYAYDAKKRLTLSEHQPAEFKERKILLGRQCKIREAAPRDERSQDEIMARLLRPRTVGRVLSQARPQGCDQVLFCVGEKCVLLTPVETVPSAERAESPKPAYPRSDKAGKPPSKYDGLRPEDAVIDGIEPPPFRAGRVAKAPRGRKGSKR